MPHQETVSRCFPEAQAVEEPRGFPEAGRIKSGCWFIYSGPELHARVLGFGTTEATAWADAAHKLRNARRRVRWVLAG